MLAEINLGVKHYVQQRNINQSTVSQSSSGNNRSSIQSVAHPITTAYRVILKGKVRTQETLQFTYSIQLQFSQQFFPFSNEATTSSLLIFHASLLLSFSFFRMLRHWVVVFSLLTVHRKCVVAKQVPVTVSTPH